MYALCMGRHLASVAPNADTAVQRAVWLANESGRPVEIREGSPIGGLCATVAPMSNVVSMRNFGNVRVAP